MIEEFESDSDGRFVEYWLTPDMDGVLQELEAEADRNIVIWFEMDEDFTYAVK